MAFIDTSEAEWLPVYYNVAQAVGVNRVSVSQDLAAHWSGEISPVYAGGSDKSTPDNTTPTVPGLPGYVPPTPSKQNTQSKSYPCPNLPDDTRLVQYLLKSFYDALPSLTKPKGEMKVDGICGPITNNWILRFQLDANQYSGEPLIIVDNRVDRVINRNLVGSVGNKKYTLAVLNYYVKEYNPNAWYQTPYVIPIQNPSGLQLPIAA